MEGKATYGVEREPEDHMMPRGLTARSKCFALCKASAALNEVKVSHYL